MKKKINKYKICTVVGTRPEIIRLSVILKKFDNDFDHTLIHTGQNFDNELSKIFFDDLDLKLPKYQIKSFSGNTIGTISKALLEVDKILNKINPDAFFVLGDTNSALALFVQKKEKFLYSIMRLAIDRLIKKYRKKQIEK